MTATDVWTRLVAAAWWLILSIGVLISLFLMLGLVGGILWGLWQIVSSL